MKYTTAATTILGASSAMGTVVPLDDMFQLRTKVAHKALAAYDGLYLHPMPMADAPYQVGMWDKDVPTDGAFAFNNSFLAYAYDLKEQDGDVETDNVKEDGDKNKDNNDGNDNHNDTDGDDDDDDEMADSADIDMLTVVRGKKFAALRDVHAMKYSKHEAKSQKVWSFNKKKHDKYPTLELEGEDNRFYVCSEIAGGPKELKEAEKGVGKEKLEVEIKKHHCVNVQVVRVPKSGVPEPKKSKGKGKGKDKAKDKH